MPGMGWLLELHKRKLNRLPLPPGAAVVKAYGSMA